MSYYLKKGIREIGPLEVENLVALLQAGDCLPTDLIRPEQDADGWVTAEALFPEGSWTRQEGEPALLVGSSHPLAVTVRQLLNEEQDEEVSRKLIAALAGKLRRGERVQAVAVQKHLVSMMHLVTEAVVTTSERVLIVRDLVFGKKIEEIAYADLAVISVQKELLGATVKIETRDRRTWTIESLPKESAEQVVRGARTRKEQVSLVPVELEVEVNAEEKGDPLARLKRLKELFDEGVISEEDYAAKKREILGRI